MAQEKKVIRSFDELSQAISFPPDRPDAPPEHDEKQRRMEQRAQHNEYRNPTYMVVSRVAYLIGVEQYHFESGREELRMDVFQTLEQEQDARIIRHLCRLRTAMEQRYREIFNAFGQGLVNINSLPDLIPQDAVETLSRDGVRIYVGRPDINQYLVMINQELSNRVGKVKRFFPEWLRWDFVKPLFIMPDGLKADRLKAQGEFYNSDRNRYPYQCYINWNAIAEDPVSRGNILYNDEKFVTLIYRRYGERFENLSLVRDAGNQTMRNLGETLDGVRRCVMVVDCENSDAVKLAAVLSSLTGEQRLKIVKILLFDSHFTTPQWSTMVDSLIRLAYRAETQVTGQTIDIEHIIVERLNLSKSQVDMTLAVRTAREYWQGGADGVILVSSDSDYWAMIQQMDQARFLVMLEKAKTGQAILDVLEQHEITYCFIDDFCTAASYSIKTTTLVNQIQARIDAVLAGEKAEAVNVRRYMDEELRDSWITMTEREKEDFYSRYLLHMRIAVDGEGRVSLQIGNS